MEIGVVVCSGSVRVGGQENYDLALAKIKSEYCKNIDLQYRGGKNQKDTKTFVVTDVDDNLVDGKKVFLFGHSSGFREGKLQLSKPTSVPEAPYGNFIGEKDDQNITVHGCIKVQSTGGDSASLGGDSGGLWVNETGEAVGIQLMAGGDFAWLHPMTLVMDYFKKHYDGSLRFLKQNDLAKMSML